MICSFIRNTNIRVHHHFSLACAIKKSGPTTSIHQQASPRSKQKKTWSPSLDDGIGKMSRIASWNEEGKKKHASGTLPEASPCIDLIIWAMLLLIPKTNKDSTIKNCHAKFFQTVCIHAYACSLRPREYLPHHPSASLSIVLDTFLQLSRAAREEVEVFPIIAGFGTTYQVREMLFVSPWDWLRSSASQHAKQPDRGCSGWKVMVNRKRRSCIRNPTNGFKTTFGRNQMVMEARWTQWQTETKKARRSLRPAHCQ